MIGKKRDRAVEETNSASLPKKKPKVLTAEGWKRRKLAGQKGKKVEIIP